MALEIETLKQTEEKETTMQGWTANRDLFLATDGTVVEAGDPASAFLLVREGSELTAAEMKRHKVKKTKPRKGKK